MKNLNFEFCLNDQLIDKASQTIVDHLSQKNCNKRDIVKLRISVENVLLHWQSELGENTIIAITSYKSLGQECIRMQCEGVECNPFTDDEQDIGRWAKSLRSTFETAPSFDYLGKKNSVCFYLKKKQPNRLLIVLGCVLAGILIGLLGTKLPAETKAAVSDTLLTPLYDTYISVLSLSGIPLIFLSIVTGILGAGDIHTFSLIGKKMVLRMFCIVAVITTATLIIATPMMGLTFGNSTPDIKYGEFIDMIFGWIPTGVFTPFIEGDAMQLIFLGAVFGIALLVLGGCSGTFVNWLNDANVLLLKVFHWFTELIPIFVTVTIAKSMWTSETTVLLSAWKSWVITTGLQILTTAIFLFVISAKRKVSPILIIKKILPTFLISLGTNSSVASSEENYACCEQKLGINYKIYSFGIPVGTSTFKPATAVRLVLLALFMANSKAMTISYGWLLMLAIMAIVLSIAIPAIPGGTLMFCPMLFAQLGIPTEVITQMLATDVFFDCICTALNQVDVELVLADYAAGIEMLDNEKLHKPLDIIKAK